MINRFSPSNFSDEAIIIALIMTKRLSKHCLWLSDYAALIMTTISDLTRIDYDQAIILAIIMTKRLSNRDTAYGPGSSYIYLSKGKTNIFFFSIGALFTTE